MPWSGQSFIWSRSRQAQLSLSSGVRTSLLSSACQVKWCQVKASGVRTSLRCIARSTLLHLACASAWRLRVSGIAYKAVHNTNTLHMKQYILRTLCILCTLHWRAFYVELYYFTAFAKNTSQIGRLRYDPLHSRCFRLSFLVRLANFFGRLEVA